MLDLDAVTGFYVMVSAVIAVGRWVFPMAPPRRCLPWSNDASVKDCTGARDRARHHRVRPHRCVARAPRRRPLGRHQHRGFRSGLRQCGEACDVGQRPLTRRRQSGGYRGSGGDRGDRLDQRGRAPRSHAGRDRARQAGAGRKAHRTHRARGRPGVGRAQALRRRSARRLQPALQRTLPDCQGAGPEVALARYRGRGAGVQFALAGAGDAQPQSARHAGGRCLPTMST